MTFTRTQSLSLDRAALVEWYLRNRERSRRLFDLIDPAAYLTRPIALRNPIVFYEGHLPAFTILAFLKRGLGLPGVDERLEQLFARGIDPDSVESAVPRSGASTIWPPREEVLAFGRAADAAVIEALQEAPLTDDRAAMHRGEAIFTALEHEAMHQETLLYMWHQLPHEQKRVDRARAGGVLPELRYETDGSPPSRSRVHIPGGSATLGASRSQIRFGWDNEFDAHRVYVPAFDIDAYNVTNADYLEFMEAGGYENRALWRDADWAWVQSDNVQHPIFWIRRDGSWHWHGMFEDIPLPSAWPVYVSWAEANAYARWQQRRLPSEAEYHRAAFGTPSADGAPRRGSRPGRAASPRLDARGAEEREFPWGSEPPDASRGNFDFASWEPIPTGARPAGASAWGVHDLIGNGWEWTSTVFEPFRGFDPMPTYPEYSADFFDGQHYVMKGGSPATAKELVRRSFRNWFRPNYPYVYATFRTASSSVLRPPR